MTAPPQVPPPPAPPPPAPPAAPPSSAPPAGPPARAARAAADTEAGVLLAGRYRLMGLVGAGGMGTVFRAHDTELEEVVALKVLRAEWVAHPTALARFRQEVKLARRVTHPHIARIYDLGEHGGERFLTMEYVDGESLGARLAREGAFSVARAVSVMRAVVQGLAAVHAAGVIHRDLKPDNVLIARDGRVVLTDFGIARAERPEDGLAHTAGVALGTPEYMAPEQFTGTGAVDVRTDLFAAGVMLFELLAGVLPWTGPTAMALLVARVSKPPADLATLRPELPAALVSLVHRLLATDPAARLADAPSLDAALAPFDVGGAPTLPGVAVPAEVQAEVARAEADRRKSVAVLPLAAGEADGHLAEGVVEEVTDRLSMTAGLRVVARGRVEAEARRGLDPGSLGRALDAQVLVGGSLARLGDNVVLRVRLTSALDGIQFWAQRFEGPLGALFQLSELAARAIADALTVAPATGTGRPLLDPVALDLFLRGRQTYHKFWRSAVVRAADLMQQAQARAPDDPLIAGGLALARARLVAQGAMEGGTPAEVRALARKALAQVPALPEARMALATLAMNEGDAAEAGRLLGRLLRDVPGQAEALELAGRLRAEIGPLTEAVALLEAAERLEPELAGGRMQRARCFALMGDWEAAWETVAVDETDPERKNVYEVMRIRLALWARDTTRAQAVLAELGPIEDLLLPVVRILARAIRDGRLPSEDRQRLEALTELPIGTLRLRCYFEQLRVEVLLALGEPDGALDALGRAEALGLFDVCWLEGCVLFAPVRGDARYQRVHQRVSARAAAGRAGLDGLG